jgi:hypothetical protein
MANGVKISSFFNNFFLMACSFVMACCEKNAIHDSMIQKKKRFFLCMMTWRVIHITLTWDLIYPCHDSKMKII